MSERNFVYGDRVRLLPVILERLEGLPDGDAQALRGYATKKTVGVVKWSDDSVGVDFDWYSEAGDVWQLDRDELEKVNEEPTQREAIDMHIGNAPNVAAQLAEARRELAAARERIKVLEAKQAEWETALSGLGQALFFFRHFDESTVFETAKRLVEEHKARTKALEPFAGAANLLHEDTDETIALCIFDGEDEYTSPLFIDKALIDALEVRHLRAAHDALKAGTPQPDALAAALAEIERLENQAAYWKERHSLSEADYHDGVKKLAAANERIAMLTSALEKIRELAAHVPTTRPEASTFAVYNTAIDALKAGKP